MELFATVRPCCRCREPKRRTLHPRALWPLTTRLMVRVRPGEPEKSKGLN